MNQLSADKTVGDLVTEQPSFARIFEKYGIDYCCGGRRSLALACKELGQDLGAVLSEMDNALQPLPDRQLDRLSLAELANHIVSLHHEYLRDTLPVLVRQVERVATVHGPNRPELLEVRQIFRDFAVEMMDHIEKEEKVLFPMISGGNGSHVGALPHIIEVMEAEHESAGDALAQIRDLTRNYEIPEGACGTYRSVLQGLAELEQNTQLHVHDENAFLFRRALEANRSQKLGLS